MNQSQITKFIDLVAIYLSLISVCGALVYKIYRLDTLGVFLSLLIATILFLTILYLSKNVNNKGADFVPGATESKIPKNKLILSLFQSIFYLGLVLCLYLSLFVARTNESLISPWQKVDKSYFLLLFFSALVLSAQILYRKYFPSLLLSFYALSIFSVTLLVYAYGFGFDFFIHEATLELIDQQGAVNPKPLYYLGQYSLIIIAHKLSFVPISWLHILLVPLGAALLLPLALKRLAIAKGWAKDLAALASLLALPLLSFFFFNSTPQNFAYLLMVLVIIRALSAKNLLDFSYLYSLSLAALFTQPIAGIPALLLSLAIHAHIYLKTKYRKIALLIFFLASTIALPLAFALFNTGTDNTSQGTSAITEPMVIENKWFRLPDQENAFLNHVYFFYQNRVPFLLFLIAAGLYISWRQKNLKKNEEVYALLGFAFLLSYFLSKQLDFSFLINYERSDYSNRILLVAVLLFSPFILEALYFLIKKGQAGNLVQKLILLLFFLSLIPTIVYLSYPRLDNYHNSHGYSLGQDDIEAVHFIENDSQSDYIVLANQQTSVAALREFGFKHYYQSPKGESIFFYPIPTGGSLYSLFLEMVNEKPSRETMLKSMDLSGTDTAYFVMSKYWWASDRIIEEAKLEADNWQRLGDGAIHIFKYTR
jgi:hypothetical protein